MNEFMQNTPSELLNLFIDGELDGAGQSALFKELANNAELQREMNELLAIRESVKKDAEAFAPPLEAAHVVFSGLGFRTPLPVASNGIPSKYPRKRVFIPIAAAFIAALITFAGAGYYYNQKFDELNSKLDALGINSISSLMENGKALPIIKSEDFNKSVSAVPTLAVPELAAPAHKISRPITTPKADNRIVGKFINSSGRPAIIESPVSQNSAEFILKDNIANSSIDGRAYNLLQTEGGVIPALPAKEISYAMTPNSGSYNGLKISLHFRGISGISFPSTDVPSNNAIMMSNTGIGILAGVFSDASIFKNIKAGLEFGEEPFGLKFKHKNDGETYTNREEITPVLYWGSLVFRAEMYEIESFLNAAPFVQAGIGGTEIGPLAKCIIGLHYKAGNGLGMSLGIEGSSLFYGNQNNHYSTQKLGFTYGLSYDFGN